MMKPVFRPVAVAAALLSAALFLASCSSDDPDAQTSGTPATSATTGTETPSETPEATPTVPPAPLTSLDQISVEDAALGTLPTVEAAWPLVTDTTLSKTLIQGTGPAVNSSLQFAFYYIGINARTGELFDTNYISTSGTSDPYVMGVNGGLIEGFTKSVQGVNSGSRVLMAITSADGYSTGNVNAGIEIGDTIVFVVDIMGAAFTGPSGTVAATGDAYAGVTDVAGVPKITPIAGAGAPEKTVVTVLTAGSSEYKVAATDAITVRYTGIVAGTGRVLESNYAADTPELALLSRLIPGFTTGLLAQSVGSRVMLTIPASEAYPSGSDDFDPPLAAGQTLIYVVDILWTQPVQ
jgi:peptidylprolyl isomerase